MYDIIIVAVPYTHINVPPLAPAVLKGVAEAEGHRVKAVDLGMELYKECNLDLKKFNRLQEYFISSTYETFNPDDIKFLDEFILKWANYLAEAPTKFVGISIFSYFAHLFTLRLAEEIRKINPTKQIVLGGAGCSTESSATVKSLYNLTKIESMLSFGKLMSRRKLVDHVILGDGEQALLDLLNEDTIDNSLNYEVNYKTLELPFANFDDYDLWKYPGQLNKGYPQMPIFGSKGCVRNCDFCDVNAVQGRFRFRTGKNIFKEILFLAEKYGIRDFNFTDSLVNGSLSSFMEWVSALAEYNNANPDKRITWNGSWICRPIGQMPQKYYQIMAESGCESLTTGFESGSDRVLTAMVKKTNVAAFKYEMEQLSKYNIKVLGLFIIGHWAETWEDFVETCDFLYYLTPYSRNGQLIGINLGAGAGLIANTPAAAHVMSETEEIWWNDKNPNLTAKERYFRWLLADRICRDLKIPVLDNTLGYIYASLQRTSSEYREFYSARTAGLELSSSAESAYMNYRDFLDSIVQRNYVKQVTLEFEFECHAISNLPKLQIIFNGQNLFDQSVNQGTIPLQFNTETQHTNTLKIRFYNKKPNDTEVSESGEILRDTYVLIKSMIIDKINITTDYDYFREHTVYTVNQISSDSSAGFWMNESELTITFEAPFWIDYAKKSDKNFKYGVSIITELSMPPTDIDDEYYIKNIVKMLQAMDV